MFIKSWNGFNKPFGKDRTDQVEPTVYEAVLIDIGFWVQIQIKKFSNDEKSNTFLDKNHGGLGVAPRWHCYYFSYKLSNSFYLGNFRLV